MTQDSVEQFSLNKTNLLYLTRAYLIFSMADSVSMRPNVQTVTVTLLCFIASSCCRLPKKPFRANLVAMYGRANGAQVLPAKFKNECFINTDLGVGFRVLYSPSREETTIIDPFVFSRAGKAFTVIFT